MLPGLYQESLHHISPVSRRINHTKVSGSRNADHLNISALDTRHNILTILESWSGFIAERLGKVAPSRSVAQLEHFLQVNLEWLTAQPPAADFADEIEDLKTELLRTIDPEPGEARGPARECVVEGCPGTIATAAQEGGAGQSVIGCSYGHTWELREWITLRPLMERRRKAVSA